MVQNYFRNLSFFIIISNLENLANYVSTCQRASSREQSNKLVWLLCRGEKAFHRQLKSAEPRAEQQARLIAMPRRESFTASAKERRAESRATSSLDCYAEARKLFSISKRAPFSPGCDAKLWRIIQVGNLVDTEWTPRNKKWTPKPQKWTPKYKKWTPKYKKWTPKRQKWSRTTPKSQQTKRGIPLIREVHLFIYII